MTAPLTNREWNGLAHLMRRREKVASLATRQLAAELSTGGELPLAAAYERRHARETA
ncbi:MAG: hypothetical protein ACRDJW_04595 [Thermomicrobiales bacterium]